MREYRCDILVIGAGPAGSSAALNAAQTGAKVLLIDRKPVIGEPVRCAEFIPKQLLGELECGKEFIVQPVRNMKSILPGNNIIETPSPGFIIERNIFDRALAEKALETGVDIWTETRALAIDGKNVHVLKNRERITLRAEVIIGADGPHTRVGKWMDSPNRDLISAVQVRVALTRSMDCTEVYFHRRYYGGYAWLFPKGSMANAGLGIRCKKGKDELRKHLDCLLNELKRLGRIEGEITGFTAGWIPAESPKKIVRDNVMLVGDAAGQTHPITGAGVSQAVICGRMAGKWAAESVKKDDPRLLEEYEKEWTDLYGESQARAMKRRRFMENNWDDLDKTIRKCWVAFREYYRE